MCDELKIVHGKPRHGQNQGSVERANKDVEDNMSSTWLESNRTRKWSGLHFVQIMKNKDYHTKIKCSPYQATTISLMKVGLKTCAFLLKIVGIYKQKTTIRQLLRM